MASPPFPSDAPEFSTDRHPSPFIISVGNIAFGGRGKTPTVAAIAKILLAMGERPAILSRGYGRRVVEDGVVVVSDGRHLLADLDRSGDEPLMLARDLPGVAVLVCDQRAVAGALARHTLGATALILDDGFQHREMARDVDVVIVTPGDLSGRRAPLGRLRESPSALARADAVVLDAEMSAELILRQNQLRAHFRLRRHAGPLVALATGGPAPGPAPAPGARVFALAGIAGPARFLRAVADAGFVVAGAWTPGDHQRYTRADVARLARDARAGGAGLVLTTAKDAERLRPFRPLPLPVWTLPLTVTIERWAGNELVADFAAKSATSSFPASFAAWLAARVADARRQPGRQHRPTEASA